MKPLKWRLGGPRWVFFLPTQLFNVGRDSSVGMAICYCLDGPGIEYWWEGKIFCTGSDRPRVPPSLLYNGYQVFPGSKAPRLKKE